MDTHGSSLLYLTVLYLTLAEVWSKHGEQRNLFALRACCRRQSHFVYIGQDISGSPVSMDVGMCRSHCGSAYRTSNDRTQQDYLKYSSMLEFLRSKKMGPRTTYTESAEPPEHTPSCGESHVCEPTGMRVDRVLLFEGPREVEVIQECHCEARITQCLRTPALRTYFFETPYENVVDVGGCTKSKGSPDGFSCVPTKFASAIVETPNKLNLVQTVVACELKESCYRVPSIEYYYEIVDQTDGIKEEKLKEIDVGRCMGGCTAGNRCLLRSPSDPEICRLWAERPQTSCAPQSHESHTFLNQHGQTRTVLSITSCQCQN
ncbi:unnamed protein product [Gadus morhua 'NCC']